MRRLRCGGAAAAGRACSAARCGAGAGRGTLPPPTRTCSRREQRSHSAWPPAAAPPGAPGASRVGDSEVSTGEFCCLLHGYATRCATCPLPRAVQELLEGGGFRDARFRAFGRKAHWEHFAGRDRDKGWGSGDEAAGQTTYEGEAVSLEWALEVLGLAQSPPRTTSELKLAFKAGAKKLHPDVGGEAAQFRRLVRAYEVATKLFRPRGPPRPARP